MEHGAKRARSWTPVLVSSVVWRCLGDDRCCVWTSSGAWSGPWREGQWATRFRCSAVSGLCAFLAGSGALVGTGWRQIGCDCIKPPRVPPPVRRRPVTALLLLGVVLYHIALPGPIAHDRFYVPAIPIVCVLVTQGAEGYNDGYHCLTGYRRPREGTTTSGGPND